ncbi:MAG: AAA family ATPase [Acetobacter fabarum]|uniref:ParA family protein n=1 Tax=Acetobacter fabarum TaxID=483199 RepID=UPI00242B015C|nr:AAA family ATPase [Acetobacter fabarum]MCH4025616.1 AAA family ATPase [Acetobacter fabarum]MCH4054732.1 AAA family ATPase [Acetobacter fabarum]MCH4086525.1 AAA family ATPase [Acetobacter fabarum]MCH4138400.1 AAA family ATPase [Acetobacter fabarum]MCI1322081.1 AAA family ATPase [Acetobacter fabarum]
MKILTLYNHKGGVSKTTSTFNLASRLADEGYRVLMVDADPQCNLTEIALAPTIATMDIRAEAAPTSAEIPDLPGSSVLDALNQRIQGEAAFIDLSKVKTTKITQNLWLLRGSVDLSSIEDDLAEAHVQRQSTRTNLMRTYVAIGDLLTRLAAKEKYEYIFVDVGPSSGALTRAFFLVCDAFFIPVAPDRFNVQAISTLAKILDRWMSDHAMIKSQYEELGLPVRPGTPAFLGAIVQAFKLYGGKPKPGYKLWMGRLPRQIEASLKPIMQKYGKNKKLFLPTTPNPIAIEVPDFNQLAPLMQEVGKAVFNITQKDTAKLSPNGTTWKGGTWIDAEDRMEKYRELFDNLIKIIKAWDR